MDHMIRKIINLMVTSLGRVFAITYIVSHTVTEVNTHTTLITHFPHLTTSTLQF